MACACTENTFGMHIGLPRMNGTAPSHTSVRVLEAAHRLEPAAAAAVHVAVRGGARRTSRPRATREYCAAAALAR